MEKRIDKEKPIIIICLGSSCFARGNKNILKIIDQYIKDNKLEDQVIFHGSHCEGRCEKGPNIKFNDEIIENVSASEIVNLLNQHFKNYKKQ
jgi:NADH:ubiquinone oxidoreductase subunit E